uniref:(California timema) hypothetical protein n=1 Tax=Timema californicum TaxID=61474 RepID=A0A7R9P3U4_TIMCA|nr:unnamed protein product [Timema californicum]
MGYKIDWIFPTLRQTSSLWNLASSITFAAVGIVSKIIVVSHLNGLKDALQDIRNTEIDVILYEALDICAATSLEIGCFFKEKRAKKRKRLIWKESEDTVLTGKQRYPQFKVSIESQEDKMVIGST